MAYALAISVLLNAVLAIVVVWLLRRRRGRPLPRRQPDFAVVESALRESMAKPDVAAKVQLDTFEGRHWLCRASLRHLGGFNRDAFETARRLVREFSQQCQLPGRVAGTFRDPATPDKLIGSLIEFGYSSEVGYRHRNEFIEPRAAN